METEISVVQEHTAVVQSTDSRDYEGDEHAFSYASSASSSQSSRLSSCSTQPPQRLYEASCDDEEDIHQAIEELGVDSDDLGYCNKTIQQQQVLQHLGLDLELDGNLDLGAYPFLSVTPLMQAETEASVNALISSEANELLLQYINDNSLSLLSTELSPALSSPALSSPSPMLSPPSPILLLSTPSTTLVSPPPSPSPTTTTTLPSSQYFNNDDDNDNNNNIDSNNISPLYTTNDSDSGICFTFEYEFQDQQLVQIQPTVALTNIPTTAAAASTTNTTSAADVLSGVAPACSSFDSIELDDYDSDSGGSFLAQSGWKTPASTTSYVTNERNGLHSQDWHGYLLKHFTTTTNYCLPVCIRA